MSAVRLVQRSSSWSLFLSLSVASVLAGCRSSSEGPPDEPPPSDNGTPLPDGGTPPSFTWGTGTDTGTLAGNVWTPGRDATGLVNEVSWALVPKGRWIEVAGTPLTSL